MEFGRASMCAPARPMCALRTTYINSTSYLVQFVEPQTSHTLFTNFCVIASSACEVEADLHLIERCKQFLEDRGYFLFQLLAHRRGDIDIADTLHSRDKHQPMLLVRNRS